MCIQINSEFYDICTLEQVTWVSLSTRTAPKPGIYETSPNSGNAGNLLFQVEAIQMCVKIRGCNDKTIHLYKLDTSDFGNLNYTPAG